jgi:hypothetical protein
MSIKSMNFGIAALLLVVVTMIVGCTTTNTTTTTPHVYNRATDFKSSNVVISDTFSAPSEFVGAEVFLKWSDSTDVLVQITDISFYKNELGEVVVGKFDGTTPWGSDTIKGIQYNNDSLLQATGFIPTSTFDGAVLVDSNSGPTIHCMHMNFVKATDNGHTLLCLSNFTGITTTGGTIGFSLKLPSTCLGVMMYDCSNFLFCGGLCAKVRTSDYWNTNTCACTAAGACYLVPDGTECVNTDCNSVCHNITGWASFCLCY